MADAPQSGTLEEPEVRAMFDRIAGIYDRLNSVMTAGLHHRWRRRAAELARVRPGARVLDLATGTGDLAFELAGRVGPSGRVVAGDFSERMLAVAREKALTRERAAAVAGDGAPARAPSPSSLIDFVTANALELPFSDGEFSAVTVGFGVRNFADLDRGLREMARVLAPGGRMVILEMTRPERPPLSSFFAVWFDRVVPLLGRLGGDSAAYTYLPSSVRRFPGPRELAARMAAVGLVDVRYILTAGGIIALHVGTVRE